jgi:hypothetical protein
LITQNAAVEAFDVSRLEDGVRDVMQQTSPHTQAVDHGHEPLAPPVPEYVSHRERATEIGKPSAEAIVQEYETAAKEIEAMGEIVKAMVQRCEQLTSSASAMRRHQDHSRTIPEGRQTYLQRDRVMRDYD